MKKLLLLLLCVVLGCAGGEAQKKDRLPMPEGAAYVLEKTDKIENIENLPAGEFVGIWEMDEYCSTDHEGYKHHVKAVIEFKDNGQFFLEFKTTLGDSVESQVNRQGYWMYTDKPFPQVVMANVHELNLNYEIRIINPEKSLKTAFRTDGRGAGQYMDEFRNIYDFMKQNSTSSESR